MGTLRKAVVLSEGAKPGIPTLKVEKIDHSSVDIVIQVWYPVHSCMISGPNLFPLCL